MMPVTVPSPDAVATVGGHRLVELIAEGGQMEVFRTSDGKVLKRWNVAAVGGLEQLATPKLREGMLGKVARSLEVLVGVPGVEQLVASGVDDRSGEPFVVVERVAGVPLDEWIGSLDPVPESADLVRRAAVAVYRTLSAMAEAGVIHHDLHFENVLVTSTGVPTLIDLAASVRVRTTNPTKRLQAGTEGFMAPERVRHGAWEIGTPATDVWEAANLFVLAVAHSPRLAELMRRSALDGMFTPALAEDPMARPTARQMAERLEEAGSARDVEGLENLHALPKDTEGRSGTRSGTRSDARTVGARYPGLPRKTALVLGVAGLTIQLAALALNWNRAGGEERPVAPTEEVGSAPASASPKGTAGTSVNSLPLPVDADAEVTPAVEELRNLSREMSRALDLHEQAEWVRANEHRVSAVDAAPADSLLTRGTIRPVVLRPPTRPAGVDTASAGKPRPCDLVEVVVEADGWRRVRPCGG